MAARILQRKAPSGARTHFFREAQARQTEQRREAARAWRRQLVPKVTLEKMRQARERQNAERERTAERGARAVTELREFVEWAREKLRPRARELEFAGVRLSRQESEALRDLVNQRKLSPEKERLVGEALEKFVRKEGGGRRKAA